MSERIDALLDAMRSNPANVRFADACRVATHFFGPPRNKGSSHWIWKMPWAGDPRINLQRGAGGKAKPYQVRQVVLAVDRLLGERQP